MRTFHKKIASLRVIHLLKHSPSGRGISIQRGIISIHVWFVLVLSCLGKSLEANTRKKGQVKREKMIHTVAKMQPLTKARWRLDFGPAFNVNKT
jgi:hypothetical protein